MHQEPPEARKPTARWRLYVFKNGEPFGDPLHIHRCVELGNTCCRSCGMTFTWQAVVLWQWLASTCSHPAVRGALRECRMSSYLFGRERRVVDVPTDHPSCSKQHAVLQFRCGAAVGFG